MFRGIDSRAVVYFVVIALAFYFLTRISSGGLAGVLGNFLYLAIALLIAIDVHEFGHAFVADRLGDSTARLQGRVTLNPIKHLDPFGTLMLIMTFLGGIGIGWGKPVQVNPSRVANGRNGMAIIAVAGVIANLLTAVAAALLLRLGIFSGVHLPYLDLPRLIATIAYINVLLAVFNFLVPLPPLDGFNFLVNVLPLRWSWQLRQIERFGPIILLLLVLGSQMHILLFNPLQYLVGAPSLWLSHALGVA